MVGMIKERHCPKYSSRKKHNYISLETNLETNLDILQVKTVRVDDSDKETSLSKEEKRRTGGINT